MDLPKVPSDTFRSIGPFSNCHAENNSYKAIYKVILEGFYSQCCQSRVSALLLVRCEKNCFNPAFKHEFIDVLVVFAQALYMLLELLSFACLCELLDDAVGNVRF